MVSEGEERTFPFAATLYKFAAVTSRSHERNALRRPSEEDVFSQLPENIIARQGSRFSLLDRDRSLLGKIRLLSGSIEQVSLLFAASPH